MLVGDSSQALKMGFWTSLLAGNANGLLESLDKRGETIALFIAWDNVQ